MLKTRPGNMRITQHLPALRSTRSMFVTRRSSTTSKRFAVWGYVKYHHPIFVNSTVNVDYELSTCPKWPMLIKQPEIRFCEWVKGLGEYTSNQSKYDEESAGVQHWSTVDLGWTADTARLGADLSVLLQGLRYAER